MIIPPKKGRKHVLRVIRDLLAYQPKGKGTDLGAALEAASRIMNHTGIIFIMSDFIADGYEIPLKRLVSKHDVVAISIEDQREKSIPEVGPVLLTDPETGEEALVDTSSYAFKKWFEAYRREYESSLRSALKGKGELVRITSQEDYGEAIVRFFHARSRRKR